MASVGSLFSIADPGQGTSMVFTEVAEALVEVKEAAQRLGLSGHSGHWSQTIADVSRIYVIHAFFLLFGTTLIE